VAVEELTAPATGAVTSRRLALHPRLLLDVSTMTLVRTAVACALPSRRERLIRRLLETRPDAMVCYSVRSGFDLLLNALALPPGSEVVFSAVTHPDMPRIAEAHGLGAVPADIDLNTLTPHLDRLEQAFSDRTRIVVVAHLFGGRVDLGPIARLAKDRGALLVEDCAQALRSSRPERHPDADVSLFSFGTIKTATALGGALMCVADRDLRVRMCELEAEWPVQARSEYLRKVLKVLALVVVGRPRLYALLARATADLDALVCGSVRAFPGPDLLLKIRQRPSAPLLWLLQRRLERFDDGRLQRRIRAGEDVAKRLPAWLFHPGGAALDATHWVFPVLTEDPQGLIAVLRANGFDAARATSGIGAVPAPLDRQDQRPSEAERLLATVLFLPVYPELPDSDRDRMLAALR
jgi:dTDP-4-amino-4,6-dideoxygalactose transaminase